MNDKDLLGLVNGSGFAFQLAVEHQIRSSVATHGWEVVSGEHAWRNPNTKEDGYADLVLEKTNKRAVLECKRVKDGAWVFLVSGDARLQQRLRLPCVVIRAPEQPPVFDCADRSGVPETHEAGFCVVRGTGEGERSMLERLTGPLITAVSGIANEQLLVDQHHGPRVIDYVPMVVTSAVLYVCRFQPGEVALDSGTLPAAPGRFEEVPYLRFFKSLTTLSSGAPTQTIKSTNQDRQRSVLVVNARHLVDLLQVLQIRPAPL